MPLRYDRDDAKQRIVVTSSGTVNTDEVLATLDRQAAEGTWSYGVLYDARTSGSKPTMDDMRRIVLRVGVLTTKYGPRGPVAFVTGRPDLFKMGRMYSTLAELAALEVKVFATVEQAEEWLTHSEGAWP